MSHHRRGVLDGVVHYCDYGWWTSSNGVTCLHPWCHHEQGLPVTADTQPAPSKHEAVTCFLCIRLRGERP